MRGRQLAPLLVALALLVSEAASPQPPPRVAPGLRARAEAEGSARVLVQLDVSFVPEGRLGAFAVGRQRLAITRAREDLAAALRDTSHRFTRSFETIPFAALEVGMDALAALEGSGRALALEEDRLLRPVLASSVPVIEGDQALAAGFDGSGWTVAVIDSGADGGHAFLADALIPEAEACFSTGRDCPNGSTSQLGTGAAVPCDYATDGCSHGSHVSGIAVGENASFHGAAPAASLIAVQVASMINSPTQCAGTGEIPCALMYTSDIIAGLEHVYGLRGSYAIAAVNLSLGGDPYSDPAVCDASEAATKAAIDNLRAAGIATVAAAGNDSLTAALSAPACISSAVSVGATSDIDTVRPWSNSAWFLSLLAPGTAVTSSVPFALQGVSYATWSGTSMATPFVSGSFALLRQAVPGASVTEALAALQATGVLVTDPKSGVTTPRIAVLSAIRELQPACANDSDDDGDGAIDFPADPGCANAMDDLETSAALVCDDGVDNDGDGLTDVPADPGCRDPAWSTENPQCDDGLDNDGDWAIDWDGVDLNGDGDFADPGESPPDPHCTDTPWRNSELAASGGGRCGLGFELAPILLALFWRRHARRRCGAATLARAVT